MIADLAHMFKGMGGNIKAERLHKLAAETEVLARANDNAVIESTNRLADILDELLNVLKQGLPA